MNKKISGKTILRTGTTGTIIAAICCFTPVLVILLGTVGLSAWVGWLDFFLFPALGIFMAITGYGLYLRRRNNQKACCEVKPQE
ncbi:MAG: mercury resistance system transport protein MerF [Nitrospinota bacterium]